jgi:hypothetical protein
MIAASSRDRLSRFTVMILISAAALAPGIGCVLKEPQEIELPPRPTAAQETKSIIDRIEGSKPAPDADGTRLKKAADSVFSRTFGALVTEGLLAQLPSAACFADGCLFQAVFPDRCSQLRADLITSSDRGVALLEWPGVVSRTQPITGTDGRVSVTWALFISAKQYPLLDKIPRPGSPNTPPPVPPCPRRGLTSTQGNGPVLEAK